VLPEKCKQERKQERTNENANGLLTERLNYSRVGSYCATPRSHQADGGGSKLTNKSQRERHRVNWRARRRREAAPPLDQTGAKSMRPPLFVEPVHRPCQSAKRERANWVYLMRLRGCGAARRAAWRELPQVALEIAAATTRPRAAQRRYNCSPFRIIIVAVRGVACVLLVCPLWGARRESGGVASCRL
jgi:hypothetical protein